MSASIRDLEERVQIVEANQHKVQELIGLLEDVKSALRVFIKIGNGLKWIAVVLVSISGAVMALRKWL